MYPYQVGVWGCWKWQTSEGAPPCTPTSPRAPTPLVYRMGERLGARAKNILLARRVGEGLAVRSISTHSRS